MSYRTPTSLTEYRLLGNSGLRVSPLCLGTMTFGTTWGWGSEKSESQRVFDGYVDRGGNFLDTANFYTGGDSECFLGEFMQGKRESLVIATKFTLGMRREDPNSCGNHRKNIVQSLEESLRRLKTDYVDLYWLHAWEFRTPIEETMRALDDLVRQGKVLYIGFSDTPAWKVAQAQTLAAVRGWTPCTALQVEHSLIERTVERELMPMAQELGIGCTPWSPLCGGLLTGKHKPGDKSGSEDKSVSRDMAKKMTERNMEIVSTLLSVAKDVGKSPAQVALNWLLNQPGVTSPIIGARKLKQLEDNLGCLEFVLPAEASARLEQVSAVEMGFPLRFLTSPFVQDIMNAGCSIETRRSPLTGV